VASACRCGDQQLASGDAGGGADEDVPQTVHSSRVAVLPPETRGYRHGVQYVVCCVLQLVADYERLATVQHQTLAQTPTTLSVQSKSHNNFTDCNVKHSACQSPYQ